MKLTKLKLASRVFGLIMGAMIVGTSGTASAEVSYMSGSSCQAANNIQANQLSWSHYRVYNPGANSLWVVCPFDNNYSYNGAGNTYQNKFALGTYHQFTNSQVRCILRKYPLEQTNAAVPFQQQFISGSNFAVQGKRTNYLNANISGYGAKSMTCLLPARTGVNMMMSYH